MQGVCHLFMEPTFNEFELEIATLIPDLAKAELFIAISGGIDSVVLTHLCVKNNLKPQLLHCNFKLRGQESDEDEQFVYTLAKNLDLKVHVKHFDTENIARQNKVSIQECARALRYEWFNTFLKDEYSCLLTAHHLDDSIETFHINSLRGTGLKGLRGIPKRRNQIVRPLLNYTKIQIVNYAKDNGIVFREDSSNQSDKYLRNQIRHQIIPELDQLTTGYKTKMKTLLNELNDINHFIEQFSSEFKQNHLINTSGIIKTDLRLIQSYSPAILTRLFSDFGITRANTDQLVQLIKATTGAEFETETFVFLKNRTQLHITNKQPKEIILETVTKDDTVVETIYGDLHFSIIDKSKSVQYEKGVAYLDYEKITYPLIVSNQFKEKKIKPLGMKGKKLISDVYIDNKLSRFEKETQLILQTGDTCLWVVNLSINEDYKITENTKRILKIKYSE